MYAGIEAGGTKFVCAVGSAPHDLRGFTTFPTTTPEETLQRAVAFIREQQERLRETVRAIGVASFGPVSLDPRSPTYGRITSTPKPGWQDTDLLGALHRAFGVAVGLDTDVNGAALAEHRWGAGEGLAPLVYVTVGTGIGGGCLVNGGLLHGMLHPEVGHLPVRRHPDDRFVGTCPYHGDCLEGLAAGPAIAARWGRPASELGSLRSEAVALEAWYLSQLATSLAYVLSPQRVIVGGGVLNLSGLLDAVRAGTAEMLNGYLDLPLLTDKIDSYLVSPGLGDRAGVLGGIALAEQALGKDVTIPAG